MERVDFSDNDFCRYSELSSAMCSEAFLKKKKMVCVLFVLL